MTTNPTIKRKQAANNASKNILPGATKNKQKIEDNAKLAAQKAKNAEALAKTLEKLKKEYIENHKLENDQLLSQANVNKSSGKKNPSQFENKEAGKLFHQLKNKLNLNTKQQKVINQFLKNPTSFLKKEIKLDKEKIKSVSPKEIKRIIAVAEKMSSTLDPNQLLSSANAFTSAANSENSSKKSGNYLLEMAKASEALGEAIAQIAQNNVEVEKFDNQTIAAQMKNLSVVLNNIKENTNDEVSEIRRAHRKSFWHKFTKCFVAALLITVGAITSLAGGAGTALIVAGTVLMTTTLASSAIQKGLEDLAAQFTKNPEEREKIAEALSCSITVVVFSITAFSTMGADLPEEALAIAAKAANAAGQGAAMGATTFSATGAASDIAYAHADSIYNLDVRNDGTAEQKKSAEKEEMTIGYVTMAVGLAGGLVSMGSSLAASRLAKSAATVGSKVAGSIAAEEGDIEMTTFSSNIEEELVANGANKTESILTEEQNLSKFQKALNAFRETNAGTNTRNFLDANGAKIVGGSQVLGTINGTRLQVQQSEAEIASAYARLFAGLDETVFHQGVKSIDLAQQGIKESQEAIEGQVVGQVQQENVRTNIEQDAMIQQAKIIASVKV